MPVAKRSTATRKRYRMPAWLKDALTGEGLVNQYKQRPPYQRNDYIMWITAAKREATRKKRTEQMLAELKKGNVYMNMAWKGTT